MDRHCNKCGELLGDRYGYGIDGALLCEECLTRLCVQFEEMYGLLVGGGDNMSFYIDIADVERAVLHGTNKVISGLVQLANKARAEQRAMKQGICHACNLLASQWKNSDQPDVILQYWRILARIVRPGYVVDSVDTPFKLEQ